ncbi:MAG: hypothetical protein IK088_03675 [Lachnospiraceae bacterium]|nr:hypothetical protein [Lachnospiraceae bacterium]
MKTYSGNRAPFIFASFAENDAEAAGKVLEAVAEKEKVFFSDKFGKKEQKTLEKASAVILFLSEKALPEMEKRAAEAVSGARAVIPVFLEDVRLPESMALLLGPSQSIMRSAYQDEEAFCRAITESSVLKDLKITDAQKKSSKRTVMFVLLGAALLVAAVALLFVLRPFEGNRISPDSMLGKLGISGSASSVRKVYLYGEKLVPEMEKDGIYAAHPVTNDGEYRIYLPDADEVLDYGFITDVSEFSQLVNLEELSLAGNSLNDVGGLLSLSKLRVLDLSYMHAADRENDDEYGLSLKGISALTNLETLYLAGAHVREGMGELKTMPSLKTVIIDRYTMEESDDPLENAPFEVRHPDVLVTNYEELKAAAEDPDVHLIRLERGATFEIPEGDTLTIRKDASISGDSMTITNRGTIRLFGTWETGMTNENNYGTFVVENGGFASGGMSDRFNHGIYIVEEGGIHELERGNTLNMVAGSYILRGTLGYMVGGSITWTGGTMQNDGLIVVAEHPNFQWYPQGTFEGTMEFAKSIPGTGRVESKLVDFKADQQAE